MLSSLRLLHSLSLNMSKLAVYLWNEKNVDFLVEYQMKYLGMLGIMNGKHI